MKKGKIMLLTLILLLAVVLVVLLIFARHSAAAIDSGDMTSLYAYSFKQTKEGLQITIEGNFPKNSVWTAESRAMSIVGVSKQRQNGKKAQFLMRPFSWGNTGVVFSLMASADAGAERFYELEVQLSIDTERKITIVENSHRDQLSVTGTVDRYNYRITSNADGSLELYAENNVENQWKLLIDGDSVAAEWASEAIPQNADENIAHYHLSWLQAGTNTVRLYSETLGESVVIEIEADANGVLGIVSTQLHMDDVSETIDFKDQLEAYVRLMGEPALPEKATLTYANAILWISRADSTQCLDVGYLEFELNGRTWTLYGSDTATDKDFFANLSAESVQSETVEANGMTAVLYDHPAGAYAAWQSPSGRNWYLKSSTTDQAAVKEAALELLQVVAE